MAFSCGFFNSKGLDRTYTAENFCDYLGSIICNGILDTYGDCFKLTAGSGLSVTLGTGKAWIDGHYLINDSPYNIDLSQYLDESLPRYVAISILLDVSDTVRSVALEITPGTPAENPTLPAFPADKHRKRLVMYAVRLNVGATKLTVNDWYDYREDENVCGYCKCILGKCRITDLMAQTAQLIAEVQKNNQTIDSLKNQVETLQTAVDDTIGGIVEIGTCGENVQYVLYSNGKLLLHGTGATFDYDIGKSPFFENENIKSLIVSDGITAIGKSVFERCSNMTSVSFPTSLTEIGERAFFMYDIGGLTELTIPASVTTIGEKAFVNLNAETVTLPVTLTSLGSNLFMDAKALVSARVECEVVPSFCFVNSSLRSLTLSHNVKKVGAHMINYTPLTEITYEGSLADWAAVTKDGSWDGNHIANGLMHKVICLDGYMEYNADTKEWTEVKT